MILHDEIKQLGKRIQNPYGYTPPDGKRLICQFSETPPLWCWSDNLASFALAGGRTMEVYEVTERQVQLCTARPVSLKLSTLKNALYKLEEFQINQRGKDNPNYELVALLIGMIAHNHTDMLFKYLEDENHE